MTLLTQQGYDTICERIEKLLKEDLPKLTQELEDTRPLNGGDEMPIEYIQALENQQRFDSKIADLRFVINNSKIFNPAFVLKNKDGKYVVGFGATVSFMNDTTETKSTYKIVSSYESDIENGLISINAPIIKAMIGLTEDEEFEYNNEDYYIESITYSA